MFSKSFGDSLSHIFQDARMRQHELVTIEHLLLGLLENNEVLEAVRACGGNIERLRIGLNIFLEETTPRANHPLEFEVEPTMGFQRVLQRAIYQAQTSGQYELNGVNVLCGIFSEQDSQAVYFLSQESVTRVGIMTYLSDKEHNGVDFSDPSQQNIFRDHADQFKNSQQFPLGEEGYQGAIGEDTQNDLFEEKSKEQQLIESYATNLNKIAEEGGMDPVIGRGEEIARCLQVLCRRGKNHPLLVGEPGVGKTALSNGLAQLLIAGEVPDSLTGHTIYALDIGSMLAGTKYRGDFEKRFKAVLKALSKDSKAIIFIDEIHNLVGAGAATGGTMDAANLIKPLLSGGEVRCVGATTYTEFRNHFAKDAALVRRFQKIDVTEPTPSIALDILKGLKSKLQDFHKISYTDAALESCIKLSQRHLNDRRLPDKAIDVLDEAGAYQQLQKEADRKKTIDAADIEEVVAKMARIPVQAIAGSDRRRLMKLAGRLKQVVFGQDKAVDRLAQAIKLARSGLRDTRKPIGSFLFPGPTGVGKTELTRQLAKHLGVELIRFDMSEYMERHAVSRLIGAPPGYVGYDQGGLLTEKVTKHPYSVLLLDEIEKAHPDMFNLLLQIMDHGKLTDNNGREADFRHVIIVMTTNAGADLMGRKQMGFVNQANEKDCLPAIEKIFSPEFRNRLDAVVPFAYLTPSVVLRIVNKILHELSFSLQQKGVELTVHEDVQHWLVKHGYCREMGARPLARLIEQKLKQPLADELLFGRLRNTGEVKVELSKNNVFLDVA